VKCDPARANRLLPYLISFAQATIPFIYRGVLHENLFGSGDWYDIYIAVSSWFVTVTMFGVLHFFLQVAIAAYFRRFALLYTLGRMVDPSDQKSINCPELRRQFIDLTIPHNISAWVAMREVLVDLGFMYRERITMYTSYVVLLAIGLTLDLIYHLLFAAADVGVLATVIITFNTLSILFPVALMILYGTRANIQFDVHLAILVRMQLHLREMICDMDIAKYRFLRHRHQFAELNEKRLQASNSLIDAATKVLEQEKILNPITLLGFPASVRMVQGLASIIAGAAVAGGRLFSSQALSW